jgi:hypothetical protein
VCHSGEAFVALSTEGQAGFWNQLVVGADKAFDDRIGGLTIKSDRPLASLIDRDTPDKLANRWDLTVRDKRLAFVRGDAKTETLSFDSTGNAQFNGAMRVDGVLRIKNLALKATEIGPDASAFAVGTAKTANLRLGTAKEYSYIQSDRGNLLLNPHVGKEGKPTGGVSAFSSNVPRKHLDVHSAVWLEKELKLGDKGSTTLSGTKLRFAQGGGWTTQGDWVASLKEKPVHFGGGAVFGTRLGIGIEVARKDFRLQVHDGHFVVTKHVSKFLKGVTTYVMPSAAFIKAYDYTRKKLQKLRITGTKVLINPGQKSDGRTCIGCTNPEHHLQSEGNMYVNGNVYVNKNLHVSGHMHIDKVITPRVFIHSRAETPEYGRGLMIGNDLPNKYKTKTNMRIGYNKGYGWIQSHKEVPMVVNPIGGKTIIGGKKLEKSDVELQVEGHAMVDGELYVATLKKKKKKPKKKEEETEDALVLLQESLSSSSRHEMKRILKNENKLEHIDLVESWASATRLIKDNRNKMQAHRAKILENAKVIRSLEAKLASRAV